MKRFSIADFRLRIEGPSVFIVALALGILTAPLAADAQQAGKAYRLGLLGFSSESSYAEWVRPLRQGLRELGYEEGKNFVFEARYADGKADRLSILAAELVRLKVDIIIPMGTGPSQAAKQATKTIPIVMAGGSDPLGSGLVSNLARPGGNITGATSANVELTGKRLELLRDIKPGVSHVAVLGLANYPSTPLSLKDAEECGQALKLQLQVLMVQGRAELDDAFAAATKGRAGSLLILGGPMRDYYEVIADLALKNRLPAIAPYRYFPDRGGLISHGVSMAEPYRRAATHVDKILKGANPGDLPVEQPVRYETVINLKTAKALGLTIPPSVIMRADEVIE